MKKFLLSAAAAAMVASVAHADNLVYELNFNNYAAGPVNYCFESASQFQGWDSYSKYFSDDKGLIVFYTNTANGGKAPYGLSVVDLGGEEGKVLCFNGYNSGLSDVLNVAVPEQGLQGPWYNFSFALGGQKHNLGSNVRVEMTYAIVHKAGTDAKTVIENMQIRAAEKGVVVKESASANLGFVGFTDQANTNEDALTEWVKYTCDRPVAQAGNAGPFCFSMQLKNGQSMTGRALLIKDIKISSVDNLEYASGNTETVAFGEVSPVAGEGWNPVLNDDNTLTYSSNNGAKLLYALKRVSAPKTEIVAAVAEAKTSFTDADFAEVSSEGSYFTISDDNVVSVNADAVAGYDKAVVSRSLDEETTEAVVMALRVSAGANNVVVGSNAYCFGESVDLTGVADIEVAGDEAAQYFNLNGVRVANPTTPGLYIRKQGATATKVVIK